MAAINDLHLGIESMSKGFSGGELKICHNCNELKDEIRNWVWKKDKPIDEGDDLIDATRYGYMGRIQMKNLRAEYRIEVQNEHPTLGQLHFDRVFHPKMPKGWMRRI